MNIIDAVLGRQQKRAAEWLSDRYFPQINDLRPTPSGRYMSYEDCLKNPTVWRCCNVRMNMIARLPRYLYKRRKDGGKDIVRRDPRQKMINIKANSRGMTRFKFEQDIILQELLYGNGFALIIRDEKTFKPVEWYPLVSKNMEVAFDKDLNKLIYRYQVPGTTEKKLIPYWNIHHRRGPSVDGLLGLSAFELGLNSFTLGISMQEYVARLIENDATPRGLITHSAKLDQKAKDDIRKAWKERYGGPQNAGEIGVLDADLKFQQLGANNDVLQYVETYGQQRENVADWFNVPQHMAGILTRSTNNNIEQQSREFIRDCLGPELIKTELQMMIDLLFEDELEDYLIEHRVEALMTGDFAEQTAYMQGEVDRGIKSINEVRSWKNLNPIPGGDAIRVPLNYGLLLPDGTTLAAQTMPEPPNDPENDPAEPTNDQNQPENPQNDPENEQKPAKKAKKPQKRADFSGYKPIIEDACRRIVGREVVALEKVLKRATAPKEVFDFAESFYDEQIEHGERALMPVLEVIRATSLAILRSDQVRIISTTLLNYRARSQEALVLKPALADMRQTCEKWADTKAVELTQEILELLNEVQDEDDS